MVCAVKYVILAVLAGVKGVVVNTAVDVSGFLIPYQLLAAAAVVFKSCDLLMSQPIWFTY
jgi:hypothetical protein